MSNQIEMTLEVAQFIAESKHIEMTLEQQVAELIAENAALKAKAGQSVVGGERRLTIRVSQKGAVCVYGLGRFPVTLYASQWTKLLMIADDLKDFIAVNADKLATKAKE